MAKKDEEGTEPAGLSADEARAKKGEMTGVAIGPDVDKSFPTYEFEEPKKS